MFKKFQKVKDIHGYRYAVSKFSWLSIYNLRSFYIDLYMYAYNLRIVKKKIFFIHNRTPEIVHKSTTAVIHSAFIVLWGIDRIIRLGNRKSYMSCLLEFCFCHQLWFMFKSHDQLKYCAIFFVLAPVLVVLVNINLNHMHDFAQC